MTRKTASSRPGLWKASWVAEARPLSSSSHQVSQRNAAVTATTSTGLNRRANGAVSRSVFAGSVTDTRWWMPSRGLDFFSSGSLPSPLSSTPIGRSFWSTRVATFSAETGRPKAAETRSPISAWVRRPSTPSSTR